MSDFIGRFIPELGRFIPELDPLTWSLTLPLGAAAALATVLVVLLALALSRARRGGVGGRLARIGLILAGGAAATWFFLDGAARQDTAAARRTLEARVDALAARAIAPGSPLACLDAMAGETVEGSCERTLFATPEAMASAVSYTAAQLRLLADVHEFAQRGHADMEPVRDALRRAIENDRYGLVAHVLATRDGCTTQQCPAVAMLKDARRVNGNLAQRTYDFYVTRHATVWPAPASGPTPRIAPDAVSGISSGGMPPAATMGAVPGVSPGGLPPAAALASPGAPRPVPGPDVFFPSAASIPPVNIMTAEPGGEPETTGSAPPRPAPRRTPAPQPKAAPKAAEQPKAASKAAEPIDLNAARSGAPLAKQ